MLFSGHNGYITVSYLLYAFCILALTFWIFNKSRKTQKKIDQLNEQMGKTSKKR